MSPLISSSELFALQESGERVHILDVRASDKRSEYLQAHIPNAVFVELDLKLARAGEPADGRHPLPEPDALQASARSWGLNDGDPVVVYDNEGSTAAARGWWLLVHAGVRNVRVLDGGLPAWIAENRPLAAGEVRVNPGGICFSALEWPAVAIDEVSTWPISGILIDVRAPERYRGDYEPIDDVGGHIPGSINLPTTEHMADGKFKDPASIRETFEAVGASGSVPVAAYCGSGVSASHTVLAGAIAGISVALYPGSWSAWSNTPGRPIETGSPVRQQCESLGPDRDAPQTSVTLHAPSISPARLLRDTRSQSQNQ